MIKFLDRCLWWYRVITLSAYLWSHCHTHGKPGSYRFWQCGTNAIGWTKCSPRFIEIQFYFNAGTSDRPKYHIRWWVPPPNWELQQGWLLRQPR